MNRILQQLNRVPPWLCYYGAHYRRDRRPSQRDLVKNSGMSHRTFTRIIHRTSWAGVTVKRVEQFANACGVDLTNPDPFLEWMAEHHASGELLEFLGEGKRSRVKMAQHMASLASEAVMAERAAK